MRIIKNGVLTFKKFTCGICGCEFVADVSEYITVTNSGNATGYEARCPTCDNYTDVSEPWEEENEQTYL